MLSSLSLILKQAGYVKCSHVVKYHCVLSVFVHCVTVKKSFIVHGPNTEYLLSFFSATIHVGRALQGGHFDGASFIIFHCYKAS